MLSGLELSKETSPKRTFSALPSPPLRHVEMQNMKILKSNSTLDMIGGISSDSNGKRIKRKRIATIILLAGVGCLIIIVAKWAANNEGRATNTPLDAFFVLLAMILVIIGGIGAYRYTTPEERARAAELPPIDVNT